MTGAEVKDITLRVEIKNKLPLELSELTKSLIALSNQYSAYSEKNGFTVEERNSILYVKEVKSGSVIIDLQEFASIGIIPFMENINTIIGFSEYVKAAIDYFKDKKGEKPDMTVQDCKELSQIINPTAKDDGSQFNMSVVVNGDIHQNIYLDSKDSNALQNILKQEIKDKQELKTGDILNNAVMVFYQTRSNLGSKVGNKVIIDDAVKGKPINVIFADPEIKRNLLLGAENPYHFWFQVDVRIKTSNEEVVAYEVIKYHDKFLKQG